MSSQARSFIFAGIMCFVCSLLLTAASSGLKGFQRKNILIDKQTNILKAVGLVEAGKKYKDQDIQSMYNDRIKSLWVGGEGQIKEAHGAGDMPVYVAMTEGEVSSYIIPINTRGLWGMIHGYLAVENDGSTIKGFTVYKHQETPGLGGEIEKRWFQKNFEGKKIVDDGGNLVSISVAKGAVDDRIPSDKKSHYVDGISGATLTGKYLTEGLKETLREYEPISVRFRKHRIRNID